MNDTQTVDGIIWDVVVIGGGNAALCAAIEAREAGASVLLLEHAPREFRGGNSRHTRNLRAMHDAPAGVLVDSYHEDEYWDDLKRVTGGETDEALARMTIRASATAPAWMEAHGVRFQPSLTGTLSLGRTNAFFLGGGKALVNAYFAAAERLGVKILYDTEVTNLVLEGGVVREIHGTSHGFPLTLRARAVVASSGGFQGNIEWLRESWGDGCGQFPDPRHALCERALSCAICSTRACSRSAMRPSATRWRSTRARRNSTAASSRAWIACRSASSSTAPVSASTMKARMSGPSATRFGAGSSPSNPIRSPIRSSTARPNGSSCRPCSRRSAPTASRNSRRNSASIRPRWSAPIAAFNAAVQPGDFDSSKLDNCHTEGLTPPKTNWARRIDTPPFIGYPLRPGITFTYLGVRVNERAQVLMQNGTPATNLWASGEIMAGNILGRGYLAGFGMAIGTVFGRIAGREAARYVHN